jgi:hypothetical protein
MGNTNTNFLPDALTTTTPPPDTFAQKVNACKDGEDGKGQEELLKLLSQDFVDFKGKMYSYQYFHFTLSMIPVVFSLLTAILTLNINLFEGQTTVAGVVSAATAALLGYLKLLQNILDKRTERLRKVNEDYINLETSIVGCNCTDQLKWFKKKASAVHNEGESALLNWFFHSLTLSEEPNVGDGKKEGEEYKLYNTYGISLS